MLQTSESASPGIVTASFPKSDVSLRSVVRECLDAASWEYEEAKKLFIEQVTASPELSAAAAVMAFQLLRTSIGNDARARAIGEITNDTSARQSPVPRYADKVSARASPAPAHSEKAASSASIKPVAPFSRHRSQSWNTPKDPLHEFQILHIPIREVTADMLRKDISMRNSRAATDTKFAKFETDLLKHMKPNKTVGKSMSDTDILDLIRKHRL